MATHQTIVYGVTGQELELFAPEGQASSVTSVDVYEAHEGDDDSGEAATSGSAAIDIVNSTVDADSGPTNTTAANRVYLTDTTGIVVGRDYLLTSNADNLAEWIEVVGIATDDYVLARAPLYNDYGAGASFVGTRLSIAVDATWVATEDNVSDGYDPNPGYRVRWRYVVDGVTVTRLSYFDLSRAPGQHGVTAADIERLIPGWVRMLPTDHQKDRGAQIIAEAYSQVAIDLHLEGVPDQQARNAEIIAELTKRKTAVLWQESRVMAGSDALGLEVARGIYDARLASLVRAPSQIKFDVATDTSGAGAKRAPIGITRR